MTTFKRLSARDTRFINTKNTYAEPLNLFYEYAEMLTKKAGKVKVRSNKAKDYRDYLVRFIIFYEDFFHDTIAIDNLLTSNSLQKFEKVSHLDGFKAFNQQSHNFYSATFSCFKSFLTARTDLAESISDEILNIELSELSSIQEDSITTSKSPKAKPNRTLPTVKGQAFPRDINEAIQAKKNSKWLCELNPNHKTFVSQADGKPFVEAHHLIPMAVQDNFKFSLDFADNIVSLCPNCHRLVHHADKQTRKFAIITLYETRKHLYPKYEIEVNQRLILSYYGILDN